VGGVGAVPSRIPFPLLNGPILTNRVQKRGSISLGPAGGGPVTLARPPPAVAPQPPSAPPPPDGSAPEAAAVQTRSSSPSLPGDDRVAELQER
jgi:hypothetical protein